jgi:hypothetical protein
MQSQEDIINNQFQSALKGLDVQKKQAQDQNKLTIMRQKALGGLTGGGAVSAELKANQGVDENYNKAKSDLEQQKGAQSLQSAQFGEQLGLQKQQLSEQQRQFNEQMNYQMKEFNENQISNFINAATALDKSGLRDVTNASPIIQLLNQLKGLGSKGQQGTNAFVAPKSIGGTQSGIYAY